MSKPYDAAIAERDSARAANAALRIRVEDLTRELAEQKLYGDAAAARLIEVSDAHTANVKDLVRGLRELVEAVDDCVEPTGSTARMLRDELDRARALVESQENQPQ